MRTGLHWLHNRLTAPIDAASLVFFRIGFGAIMAWEAWRFLSDGVVDRHFIAPDFYFKYLGFGWVEPWPGSWMYVHFYALGALALFIAVGFLYRLSATLFALGYTYIFLIDQTLYQNHYYLICLVSLLMIFVPAHRTLSVDARLWPNTRSSFIPAWPLWLLRAQIAIVYFFGGVAKLNLDWLQGYPLRDWLPGSDFYLPLFSDLFYEGWVCLLFSYAGLLIDLLAAPLLLWGRTRAWALATLLLFHCMNKVLFGIGVFPVLASSLTLLFLPPTWPRRLFNWPHPGDTQPLFSRLRTPALLALTAYLIVQTLLPVRHFLYPGNVSWTEEGHRFAWHMKLRDKDCSAVFILQSPNETWQVDPRDHLTSRQARKMATRPYMAVQFAHYLVDYARSVDMSPVKVRAHIDCSLNGRRDFPLIDPHLDLATQQYHMGSTHWILPLPHADPGELYDEY